MHVTFRDVFAVRARDLTSEVAWVHAERVSGVRFELAGHVTSCTETELTSQMLASVRRCRLRADFGENLPNQRSYLQQSGLSSRESAVVADLERSRAGIVTLDDRRRSG